MSSDGGLCLMPVCRLVDDGRKFSLDWEPSWTGSHGAKPPNSFADALVEIIAETVGNNNKRDVLLRERVLCLPSPTWMTADSANPEEAPGYPMSIMMTESEAREAWAKLEAQNPFKDK